MLNAASHFFLINKERKLNSHIIDLEGLRLGVSASLSIDLIIVVRIMNFSHLSTPSPVDFFSGSYLAKSKHIRLHQSSVYLNINIEAN